MKLPNADLLPSLLVAIALVVAATVFVSETDSFRKAVAESKYATWGTDGNKWGEIPEGRILLQDHSDSTVSFRNLKIKEL